MFSWGLRPYSDQTSVLYQSKEKLSKDWLPRSSSLLSRRFCSLA